MGKVNNYIAILLTEEILKVAQVVKGRVSNILFQDIKGQNDDHIAKTLRSVVSKLNPKKAEVCCLMPSGMTTSKNLEVPSTSSEEIKAIVSLQAGRHTPLSREEIEVGYINLGAVNNNATRVLLVIANKQILKKQLSVFDNANIEISKVLFIPEGIAKFYSNALGLQTDSSPTGIIDIGDKSSDFLIVFKSHPIVSRNIPVGKKNISDEGETEINRLVEELSVTIESYKNEDIGAVPTSYIITSGDNISQQVQIALKEKLNWDVQLIPYEENISASKSVLKKIASSFSGVSFLDVIAAASSAKDAQVDLMPDEIRMQKAIEIQGREMFKSAMLIIALLILFISIFCIRLYFKNAFLKKIQNDFKDTHEEVINLEQINDRIMVIKNYLEDRTIAVDVIHEIYDKIPTEIYLTSLIMDEEGKITLQGISDIPSSIFSFGTALRETDLFKSVNIGPTTAKKDRGKAATAFEIILNLKASMGEEKKEKQEEE